MLKIRWRFPTTYHSVATTWYNVLQHGNNVVQRSTTWLQRTKNVTEREQNVCTTLCSVFTTLRYAMLSWRQRGITWRQRGITRLAFSQRNYNEASTWRQDNVAPAERGDQKRGTTAHPKRDIMTVATWLTYAFRSINSIYDNRWTWLQVRQWRDELEEY
jgi:hypothetical protein